MPATAGMRIIFMSTNGESERFSETTHRTIRTAVAAKRPMIVVSPYVKAGHISHDYTDHVSILKFIERNWKMGPVTTRSRDNLPNPIVARDNPYVPLNGPAIGDLFDLFDFDTVL